MKLVSEKDLIFIKWKDQSYYHPPSYAQGSIQEMYGETIGIFLEKNKDWLSVAPERFLKDGAWTYRHVISFPIVCIDKIIKIKKLK